MQIKSVSEPRPVSITWDQGLVGFMHTANIHTKNWLSRPAKSAGGWCEKWRCGYRTTIDKDLIMKSRFRGLDYVAGEHPDWSHEPVRMFNQRIDVEGWFREERTTGAPWVYAGFDNTAPLFRFDAVYDRALRYIPDENPTESYLHLEDRHDVLCHPVGTETEHDITVVQFEGDDTIWRYSNESLVRCMLLAEQGLRSATLYETAAYVAKYWDQHVGRGVIPLAGFSNLTHQHDGIPVFACNKTEAVASHFEHNGYLGPTRDLFLAVPL